MHQRYSSRQRDVIHGTVTILFTLVAVGMCSGCFVIQRTQSSNPVAPGNIVKVNTSRGHQYAQVFESPDFKLVTRCENWPSGWELQFLFNILPIYRYDFGSTEPLSLTMEFEPKSQEVTFNPWQVFFIGTNQMRVPPVEVQEYHPWGVTNVTGFSLQIPVEHRAYPERDLPFQLSIEGLEVSGCTVSLPPITFETKRITRPGFRLPY